MPTGEEQSQQTWSAYGRNCFQLSSRAATKYVHSLVPKLYHLHVPGNETNMCMLHVCTEEAQLGFESTNFRLEYRHVVGYRTSVYGDL